MPKAKAGKSGPASPIGIFDSGIGGLTVFREIRKKLPREKLVYFGDTARVPYGTKSKETIIKFAGEIALFLKSLKVKMIVIACNTVSSFALEEVKRISGVPVAGVIEPGAGAAVEASENGKIIVIGTSATISSHSYKKTIKKAAPGSEVFEKACPLFVPLVEEGWCSRHPSRLIVREYLSGFKGKKYDTIILGCTHYPLLKKLIRRELPGLKIIDSARATAEEVASMLSKTGMLNKKGKGGAAFIVSDAPGKFRKLGRELLGLKISKIDVKRF